MTRELIRCDGTTEALPGPVTLAEVRRLIGAATLDVVNLHHLGQPLHVMLVDDGGWETEVVESPGRIELRPVRARKPVNAKATALYHANCHRDVTHAIVGDVVVMPDEDSA